MKIRSIKLKLISSYLFLILVSFAFVAFVLDKNLEENSLHNIQTSLTTEARLIEGQISAESLKNEAIGTLEPLVKNLALKTKYRLTVVNIRGKVLADSEKIEKEISQMENHLNRPEVRAALDGTIGIETRYSSTLKINMLYVALPLKDKNDIVGILRLALPLESVQKTLFEIRKTILFGLLLALVFVFVLGTLVANRVVGPINRMIYVSRKFSEGDFSRRIVQTSKDEIGDLASTLNTMAEDIESKMKEIQLQSQRLKAVFNSMTEGVIVADKAGRLVSVNSTVERIFGITKENAQGKAFLEIIRNNDIADVIHLILKTGAPISKEIALVYPVQRIFEVNAAPIYENGIVNGCLAVIHDITDMRKLETVRRDFVANVSHELKTPLTAIKGFTETLLGGAIEDKENNRNFLQTIQDHTERLESLINDLLVLAHLESREILLEKTDFNLRQQLEKLIQSNVLQLKKRNINIKNELPRDISVTADKDKIGQVLTNLIDNAVKFNKESGWIKVYAQDLDRQVKIIVEDSGIGIPVKEMDRIFERFYRVDKARSRELGGTGLGLSIVKHIVELHGGSVGVESTEGLGSKFWFALPH